MLRPLNLYIKFYLLDNVAASIITVAKKIYLNLRKMDL